MKDTISNVTGLPMQIHPFIHILRRKIGSQITTSAVCLAVSSIKTNSRSCANCVLAGR